MSAHTKLLVGAPLYDDCLDTSTCTIDKLLPAFIQHVKPTRAICNPSFAPSVEQPPDSSKPLVWRSLNPSTVHLATGLSQPSWIGLPPLGEGTTSAQFYQGSDTQWRVADDPNTPTQSVGQATASSNISSDDYDSESFLEQSFAMHESVTEQTGPTTVSPGHDPTVVQLLEETSREVDLLIGFRGDLTVLSDIPNAQTLDRLNPQTVTVNMLVAIISAPPPRTVLIRRTGREAQLLELVVGDDTRAGLQVTLWLDALDVHARIGEGSGGVRQVLDSLRAGDIVLLKHVALAHFKGLVHGQSLRRQWGRGGWATGVSVVCRWGEFTGVATDSKLGGEFSFMHKRLVAVQDWARRFILLPPSRADEYKAGQDSRLVVSGGSLPPIETPE